MPGERKKLSLVIPIYKNEASLHSVLEACEKLRTSLSVELEVVFVVDGSPDGSFAFLQQHLPEVRFGWQLIALSRNFGAFQAITAGLRMGKGDYFSVIAADLQEPPELILEFARILESGETDVIFGTRSARADPWFTTMTSDLFWATYRTLVANDMPKGGVDIFACNRDVRDHLVSFPESNTNIIALLFWVGFRRRFVPYERAARQHGKSAWTFRKKLRYSFDSIFNFTDLPIQLLVGIGLFGMVFAVGFAGVLLVSRFLHAIPIRGYTPIVLTIVFFGGLTCLGLGVVGQYLWLILQNVRRRPNYIIAKTEERG